MLSLFAAAVQSVMPRVQFRLRTLVIATTIAGLLLAPVRAELVRSRNLEQLVKTISGAGGEVFFDYQEIEEGGVLTQLKNDQPRWVRQALGEFALAQVVELRIDARPVCCEVRQAIVNNCPKIKHLCLRATGLTDESLGEVVKCQRLKYIEFSQNPLTDAGLAHLSELPELETLCLENTAIEGHCFGKFAKLKNLKNVALANTQVGDEAIADLAGSASIEMLFLAGTEVTDAVIPHLARMKRLNSLCLARTKVSQTGIAQLRQLRPEMSIF